MQFTRDIKPNIINTLRLKKIALIYGARQTGKTTLAKDVAEEMVKQNNWGGYLYLNCDEPDVAISLTAKTSTELKSIIGNNKIVIIDEAQRVENIGLSLKLIHDTFSDIRLIITGSSSLDLANKVIEPLTGRNIESKLFPISLTELKNSFNEIEINRRLEELLIYGSYPEVINTASQNKVTILSNISKNYLYKDLFKFQDIRNPDLINNLLKALAFQLGNEVSITELANLLEVDKETVQRYIELLEKSFVIYRLGPLARNKRNEVGKFKKIYFNDLGMRNSIIGNFNSLQVRNDVGALWENFCINERIKLAQVKNEIPNYYFWRNYYGAEIDFIEEWGGKLNSFEFKWNKDRKIPPKAFTDEYGHIVEFKTINKNNFLENLTN